MNDRECLRALARSPSSAPDFEPLTLLIERYGPMVMASAFRRTGRLEEAEIVTRAVFCMLVRRARRLSRRTTLAGWLFGLAGVASRLHLRCALGPWWSPWRWFRRTPPAERAAVADTSSDAVVTAAFDRAVDRLPRRERDAVLLRVVLGIETAPAAELLRASEVRVAKQLDRGLRRIGRRLPRRDDSGDGRTFGEAVARAAAASQAGPSVDAAGWAREIVASVGMADRSLPWVRLARRTLGALALARWRRRVTIGIPATMLVLAMAVAGLWYADARTGHSRSISMFLVWSVKNQARRVPGLAQIARPWPAEEDGPRLRAVDVRGPAELYGGTNIWTAHLGFTREQWYALEPQRIDPLAHFLQPDGTALLRNPQAQRSGLAGVLGFDFPWSKATLEFGGVTFPNVGARIKGNGTFLGSLYGEKRSFKIDLNEFVEGQRLAGMDELNLHNLVNDHSYLSDALGYEFFREAGVPASRTAYAYLSVSIDGQWTRRPLGLYGMVEPVDGDFLTERLQHHRVPLFKPVTYELFAFLGEEWRAYADIYDLKTKAEDRQWQRVIEFARLTTKAADAEFARRVGEFLDLDAFARFLACQVLLSNYDGPLSTGQNFYLYLDPASNKFGFIPWDLDLCWGGFFLLGKLVERERASIWHPWAGENRFLERVLGVEAFRERYRAQLETLLDRLFVPARLHRRIDAMAAVVRAAVAAESDFRRRKFERAVGEPRPEREWPEDEMDTSANRSAHQLKRFVTNRARSVRDQLDGKPDGIILERRRHR